MARARRPKASAKPGVLVRQDQVAQDVALHEEVTKTSTNNSNTLGERIHNMALTPEQIAELLSTSRTKGAYIGRLNEFVNSGEGGVCANDWAEFSDKKANTLKQGFENAKNSKNAADGSDNIKVLVNDEKVFLINLAAAGVGAEAVAEEAVA